jgi:hypothetical protein
VISGYFFFGFFAGFGFAGFGFAAFGFFVGFGLLFDFFASAPCDAPPSAVCAIATLGTATAIKPAIATVSTRAIQVERRAGSVMSTSLPLA